MKCECGAYLNPNWSKCLLCGHATGSLDLNGLIATISNQYHCSAEEKATVRETAMADPESAVLAYRTMADEVLPPDYDLLRMATELDGLIHQYCVQQLLGQQIENEMLAARKRMPPALLASSFHAFEQAVQLEVVQ